ncbi:glycosyltransferase [Nocardia anaemiae]|uniref:glycosyltransferase n=1 Tax=Nocardia anaemiae TaxID=263910 RepID=UPI0007A544B5|nr:glycosyltransferase [Nocardia anaemiae]
MIGYYIHHHGCGHLTRARTICAHLDEPVTALSSMPFTGEDIFDEVIRLPFDNLAPELEDPTAAGVFHWAPRHEPGLAARMAAVAAWIAQAHPRALVVDVSVEVGLLARLHGIPVISMGLPGVRTDQPHQLVHRIADLIIAAWPRELYDPDWLRPYADKTRYVGGIGRFTDRPRMRTPHTDRPTILVLGGVGGAVFTAAMIRACADQYPEYHWRTVGVERWVEDPWPSLCTADVIVSHAGQAAVSDIASAAKPAIIIPAERPFGEQDATARALDVAGLAVVSPRWPDLSAWPELISRARGLDPGRWRRWGTRDAAHRAAAAIAATMGPIARRAS